MMEMGECEICNRYRHAKHKGEQLEILAELNDVPRHKIIGILLENGEKCKTVKSVPKKSDRWRLRARLCRR